MAKSKSDPLLLEAHRVSYRLRSTFFYRKLKEYNTLALPGLVATLLPVAHLYSWDDWADWGINEDAFKYIQSTNISLLKIFCHPKALREHKVLLAYYRNLAVLSQKSIAYLTGKSFSKHEADSTDKCTLNSEEILTLTRLFNEHISLIINSSAQNFGAEELYALLLVSTGAQIDGSWRNAIGEEAEKVVQRLLIKEAVKRKLLEAFILDDILKIQPFKQTQSQEQLDTLGRYRGIMLNNQTSLLFASDPDIAFISKNGSTLAVVEIKGGTDPAGALERYGAAKKSFEKSLRETAQVQTILVASCITPEVRTRIEADSTISRYYNLSELLDETANYQEFVNIFFDSIL